VLNCDCMSTKPRSILCRVTADLSGADQCVPFNLRKTTRALTKAYDVALRPSGLRSTQFVILVWVAQVQPVSIGDLANGLMVDPSTLSRALRLMQSQRLVTVSGRSAMRQRFVTLSAQGARKIESAVPRWRQLQEHFLGLIGKENWSKMQRNLRMLARHKVSRH